MDRAKKRLAPEYIDVNDWRSMVALFVHLARNGHTFSDDHAALRERVTRRYERLKGLLSSGRKTERQAAKTPRKQKRGMENRG
jgi:hypothetical protein